MISSVSSLALVTNTIDPVQINPTQLVQHLTLCATGKCLDIKKKQRVFPNVLETYYFPNQSITFQLFLNLMITGDAVVQNHYNILWMDCIKRVFCIETEFLHPLYESMQRIIAFKYFQRVLENTFSGNEHKKDGKEFY